MKLFTTPPNSIEASEREPGGGSSGWPEGDNRRRDFEEGRKFKLLLIGLVLSLFALVSSPSFVAGYVRRRSVGEPTWPRGELAGNSRWQTARRGDRLQRQAEATCSFPGSPAHAIVSYNASSVLPGSVATYACDTNFNLLGPSRRICQPDGLWLPAQLPVCVQNETAFNGDQQLDGVGAISPASHRKEQTRPEAASRLVDRIAISNGSGQPPTNKLDYILDFMRSHKLTKFCDLLTRKEPEIVELLSQLNKLKQFTLFVPTNEALDLMAPSELEFATSEPNELRKFLLGHLASELVMPKLNLANVRESLIMSYHQWNNYSKGLGSGSNSASMQSKQLQASASSTNLVFSLAGSPLRITTVAFQSRAPARINLTSQALQSGGSEPKGTKLELIVNGANVLGGQSYALQDPSNSSLTHAIVHLIDKPLYPAPRQTMLEKIRSLSPRMFHYLELSRDLQLLEALEPPLTTSNQRLATFFLPADDSFKVVPVKLLNQLETNQTFLANFLKNHLIEGLHYSGQLAPSPTRENHLGAGQVRLSSLSNLELEFELKSLQSRSLLLVNSVPFLQPDIMTLNGVIHLIGRPIFERNLLESCNCNNNNNELANSTSEQVARTRPAAELKPGVAYELENKDDNKQNNANWQSFGAKPKAGNGLDELAGAGNELEREESRQEPALKLRSQRSGSLPVGQNNRDFYRPSAAPANLLMPSAIGQPEAAESSLNQQRSSSRNNIGQQAFVNRNELNSNNPFEVAASNSNQSSGRLLGEQLSFDENRYKVVLNATSRQRMREQQRLTTTSVNNFSYDRPLARNSSLTTETSGGADNRKRPYSAAATNGSSPGVFTESANSWFSAPYNVVGQEERLSSQSSSNRQHRLLRFKPEEARDGLNQSDSFLNKTSGKQQELPGSKPAGFAGCAFYDTQCKRLVGKLVRLPPNGSRGQIKQQLGLLQASASTRNNHSAFEQTPPTTPLNLDSTFGETTTFRSLLANDTRRMSGPRVSPLNQPLPPWGAEENHLKSSAGSAQTWRSQSDGDINRIKSELPAGFTTGISRQLGLIFSQPARTINSKTADRLNSTSLPTGSDYYLSQPPAENKSARLTFSSQQYHTPTPYSVSLATTHLPGMFGSGVSQTGSGGSPLLGRLTNFTAFESYTPPEELPQFNSASAKLPAKLPPANFAPSLRSPVELAPAAFRKQNESSFGSPEADLNGIKQARKIIRLQSGLQQSTIDESAATGSNADISVTSARLNSSTLATLASNQAPNINFIRSAPLGELPTNTISNEPAGSTTTTTQSADFFQNRTIAEIIDDSGLRIDGQQVTFGRLKECLADAELLSLVSQTGNALTIFMPTDLAFQRLVQQQAVAHQQRLQQLTSSESSRNNNNNRHLLPLVANMKLRALPTSENSRLLTGSSLDDPTLLLSGATNSTLMAAERLTLDCSSPQVRQLLLDHLSARLITPKQLQADTSLGSLGGKQLLLSSFPSKKIVMVDGQPVVAATRAKNGMVYVINKFLNLTQQMPNVMSLIESQPNLKTFASYLQFSSLADRLKRETGPITILAPTNEAFEQLSSSARQLINSDPAALTDILRGHIVEGAQFGKLISMRNSLRTLNSDQTIEAKVIRPNVYLLDNQMTSIRLVGTTGNGVVNAIDRLIVPSWLKVSLGNGARLGPTGGGSGDAPTGNSSLFVGELDSTSLSNIGPRNSPLNLPSIGDRPTRFEQPAFSTTTNNQNSFLFANTSSNFDTFKFARPTLTTTTTRSPFLRVPTNLSSSSVGGNQNTFGGTLPAGSVTRNMLLIEKLANLMQTSKFVKYLLKSRISQLLKPDMNYVLLIPTDQAIEKLPRQIIEMLERDEERLNDLINYHVLDTTFEYINTIPDGQTLNTLNEKDILFNWHRNNTILTASGAVVMGGIQEDNIAVLIVDRVLYPTPGDILNIVSKSPILSNFTSIIREAKLERQLALAGPFTLFAPSDFAFNQLPKRDLEFLQRDRDTARRFLLRHLSQPAIFTSSIALSNQTSISGSSQQIPTMIINNLLGEDMNLRQRNDYFSVNDVNFSYADVAATNGVVHVIDGLL